jgi:hypothetical protein
LERAVETGKFASAEKDAKSPVGVAEPFWTPAGKGKSGYRGISSIKKQGKIALAGMDIYDADLDKVFTVQLKLRDLGDHWQITEIAGLTELQKEIRASTEQRLAEINAPVRKKINEAVRVEEVRGYAHQSGWGTDKRANVIVDLRNLSDREIAEVQFSVTILADGEKIGAMNCRYTDAIRPGETGQGTWSQEVNMFSSGDMKLFEAITFATFTTDLQGVRFVDGTAWMVRSELKGSNRSRTGGIG